MSTPIYTVQAFRKGERTLESRILAATTSRPLAIAVAEAEEERREGKWRCEVLEFDGVVRHPVVVRALP